MTMDIAKSNWIDHGKDMMTRIILMQENELTGMENHGTQVEICERKNGGVYRVHGHYNMTRWDAEIDFMERVNIELRSAGYFLWNGMSELYEPMGVDSVTGRV